ncbi:MAG: DUF998 domain-containing protein [Candidatus Thermoplasmatota archaeon]|nr:DUF998 domain-containing protein [Candidatus Thermoplasmatota archaeon]
MTKNVYRYLAFCGVIAPILFIFVILALGFMQPEYNHITQYMSELGAVDAPYAVIMNTVGVPLLGVLIIAFAFVLNHGVNNGNGSVIGPILVVISGGSFILCGIFICDPDCIPISTVGIIHGYMCLIAQFALILAPFFMLHSLARDDKWCNYHIYSLTIAVLAVCMAILYNLDVFSDVTGLIQRISFGVPLLWVEIMSIKLLRVL